MSFKNYSVFLFFIVATTFNIANIMATIKNNHITSFNFFSFLLLLLYLLPQPIPKSIEPFIHSYSVMNVFYEMYIDIISVINAIIDSINHKFFLTILIHYFVLIRFDIDIPNKSVF